MLRKGETGDWIGTFEGHKGAVWGVALNNNASRASTGSADFEAKIWDAVSGNELHSLPHSHIVKTVAFSSDNNFLLTGSNEKLLRIYDLNKIEQGKKIFEDKFFLGFLLLICDLFIYSFIHLFIFLF